MGRSRSRSQERNRKRDYNNNSGNNYYNNNNNNRGYNNNNDSYRKNNYSNNNSNNYSNNNNRNYNNNNRNYNNNNRNNNNKNNNNFKQQQQENMQITLDIGRITKGSKFRKQFEKIMDYYDKMGKYQEDIQKIIGKSTIQHGVPKNVWNQWIIRVLVNQKTVWHPIPLPENVEKDRAETIKHIIEKKNNNTDFQDPEQTYDQIIAYAKKFADEFDEFKQEYLQNKEFIQELSKGISSKQLDNKYTSAMSYNSSIIPNGDEYTLTTLKKNYDHISKLFDDNAPQENKDSKNFYLFELLFNYSFIGGLSYQLAVPPPSMNILKDKLKVQRELFASPLNHYFEKYYSLFEIDKNFGSLGNCLNEELYGEGGVEVNPPFIETLMTQSSEKLIQNLDHYESNNQSFFAFYVLPWDDCTAYKLLVEHEKYFIDVVKLERQQHYYYEITENKYKTVPFHSYLIFVGNTLGKQNFNTQIKSDILENFSNQNNNNNK